MHDYFKDHDENINLGQKLKEEPGVKNKTISHIVQHQGQIQKKKHPIRNTILWTSAAITAATYGTYKLIWPPRPKKYAKIALTVGMVYGVTHPVTTVNAIGDAGEWIYKGVKTEYVRAVENKKAREKAKQEVKKKEQELIQKEAELSQKDKFVNDLKSKLKEATGLTWVYKNKLEKIAEESKRKEKTILELKNENYKLNKHLAAGLEGKIKEQSYTRRQETRVKEPQPYTRTPSSQSVPSNPNTNIVYFVQEKGITLGEIARRYTGSSANWRELARINNKEVIGSNTVIIKMGEPILLGSGYVIKDEKVKVLRNEEMPRFCYKVRPGEGFDEAVIHATGSLKHKQEVIEYNEKFIPSFGYQLNKMEEIWIPEYLAKSSRVQRIIKHYPSRLSRQNH